MTTSVNVPLNSRGKLANSLPAEQLAEITELFAFRRKGYSLDAPFYTDPAIFAKRTPGGLGSHVDMLHNTSFCRGIAHVEANVFWVFNGQRGALGQRCQHADPTIALRFH